MTTTARPDAPSDAGSIAPAVYQRRYLILATMCLSLVLIVATVSSVNVAIPKLAGSALTPSDTQILWIVDAYALVFAALLLPAGALGDRFGRKGALQIGLIVFACASVACAYMGSANLLIAARGVMGIGAALIMPSTLSLLQSVFPLAERPKAIAIWAGFAGAGGAIGPVLGGLLLQKFWYGSVFFIAAPLAAIALVATTLLAPKSKEGGKVPLDPAGAALSVFGFAALLMSIIEGPDRGWTDPLVIVGFAVAISCIGSFVVYERRRRDPMLDMSFFSKPRFAMGSLGITFTFLGMFSLFYVLTQYLQYVKGYTPLGAGVRGLPFAVMMILVSPRAPKIAEAIGRKLTVGVGMGSMSLGLVMMSFAGRSTGYAYVALCLVIMATGVAAAMPTLSTGILQSVPMNKAGVGSAVNDTTREVGGAIGIAVIGSIVTSVYRSHLAPALTKLPADIADLANDNVGKALAVAERAKELVPAEQAAALKVAVQQSFVDGFHVALRVAAVLVALAAAVVAARMPDRGEADGHDPASLTS